MSGSTSTAAPVVTAHCDGAAHPNPGRGGWGAVLHSGPHEKRLSGAALVEPTNQRMEIVAAINALCALRQPSRVRVYSDSRYLVEPMNGRYRRRTNLDLWELLDDVAASHTVEWIWKRGRREGEGDNALAHQLAEAEVLVEQAEESLDDELLQLVLLAAHVKDLPEVRAKCFAASDERDDETGESELGTLYAELVAIPSKEELEQLRSFAYIDRIVPEPPTDMELMSDPKGPPILLR
jgi:ribonuclease HI